METAVLKKGIFISEKCEIIGKYSESEHFARKWVSLSMYVTSYERSEMCVEVERKIQ